MKVFISRHFSNEALKSEILLLSLIGLIDAAYLTWTKLSKQNPISPKDSVFDCGLVTTSRYSEVYGIPIALLGFLTYLAVIVLLILEVRVPFFANHGPVLIFGTSLAGTLYSGYLSYLEASAIQYWCQYCVVSAICITIIFVLSIVRLARQPE